MTCVYGADLCFVFQKRKNSIMCEANFKNSIIFIGYFCFVFKSSTKMYYRSLFFNFSVFFKKECADTPILLYY